jgi:hypothetical protein
MVPGNSQVVFAKAVSNDEDWAIFREVSLAEQHIHGRLKDGATDLDIDFIAKHSSAPPCTGLRDNAERRRRRPCFAALEIAHQAVI